jgi:hypothetical protein
MTLARAKPVQALVEDGNGDAGEELGGGDNLDRRSVGAVAEVEAVGEHFCDAFSAAWQRRWWRSLAGVDFLADMNLSFVRFIEGSWQIVWLRCVPG